MLIYLAAVLFFAGWLTCFGVYARKPSVKMRQVIASGFAAGFVCLAVAAVTSDNEAFPFTLVAGVVIPLAILRGTRNWNFGR